MKKFFGTLLLVTAVSLAFGTYCWVTDTQHKYTAREHYGYCFIILSFLASIIWIGIAGAELIIED